MKTNEFSQCNNQGEARPQHLLFALDDLNFRPIELTDPVPLGRQILYAAGVDPQAGYSLSAILPSGDFEGVRLDEPFDLRGQEAKRFVAFLTDREFKLTLNARQIEWGNRFISGSILYRLADINEDQAVFLDVPGGTDRLIEPGDLFDLSEPGIERFITAPRRFEIIVNTRPKTVIGRRVSYEQIVQLAFPNTHEPNAVFSVTYRRAASLPLAGELGPGGSVDIKQGTIFDVTKTVQS